MGESEVRSWVNASGRTIALLLFGLAVWATAAGAAEAFAGGRADVLWDDADVLSVRVALNDPPPEDALSLMWVVTVLADRFADGILAWQLHLSPTHESVVVIPNDFLTARSFPLAALGIEVVEHDAGQTLHIRIPRRAPILEFIAPGDRLEVHALWVQQEPLVTSRIPDSAGGGGTAVAAEDVHAEDEGAAESEALTAVPVPLLDVWPRGEALRHAFLLLDPRDGSVVAWGAATIAFLRIDEEGNPEIVEYLYRTPDPETGKIEYAFETSDLEEGVYEIIVWTSVSAESARRRIRIAAPDE